MFLGLWLGENGLFDPDLVLKSESSLTQQHAHDIWSFVGYTFTSCRANILMASCLLGGQNLGLIKVVS